MRRFFTAPPTLPRLVSAALMSVPLLGPAFATGATADDGKPGGGPPQAAAVAVVDFDYVDTSGEERDQSQEHQARLNDFMAALRRDLAAQGKTVVTLNCDQAPCSAAAPADVLQRAAREAGARILLVGGIHKMSTLVQWAQVAAIDAATGQVVFNKLFTFRGDSDDAWRSAEGFIARQLADMR
jgi:hypothetical protein